jgi:hypothetical protein
MPRRLIGAAISVSLVSLFILVSVNPIGAHHAVRRVNLEEMTVMADRIFIGRCQSIEETEEAIAGGRFPVTRYTFEVERAVKGRIPRQLTVKHVGHAPRRASGKGGQITMHGRVVTSKSFLHGMNPYRMGERMLLFLNPDSPKGKTTSPVGLYQGAFFIRRMPSGLELAHNSINNLGLFSTPYTGLGVKENEAQMIFTEGDRAMDQRVESLVHRRGALPLDQLIEVVERIVTAHRGQKGMITGKESR